MLIRSDGLMTSPRQLDYNFEKLLSSARTTCSLPEEHAVGRAQDQAMIRERVHQGPAAGGREVECSF
jgi:hypothetical protein